MHRLPNYARRIEYLESVDGSTIQTDYYPTSGFGFVSDAFIPQRSWLFLFGRNYNTEIVGLFGANGRPNLILRTPGRNNDLTGAVDKRTHIVYANHVANVDGTNFQIASYSLPPNFPLRVFSGGSVRLYRLQFQESGSTVRSFVPCRVGSVGYLWDEVTGAFFGNSGTGNFVLGTDIDGGASTLPLRGLWPMGRTRQ